MTAIDIHSASSLSSQSPEPRLPDVEEAVEAMDDVSKVTINEAPETDPTKMEDIPIMLETELQLGPMFSEQLMQGLAPRGSISKSRTASRLHSRQMSKTELPWKIDETSSYKAPKDTPPDSANFRRASSFMPPPTSRQGHRTSVDLLSSGARGLSDPAFRRLSLQPNSSSIPASPNSNNQSRTPIDPTVNPRASGVDLSHPPGYTQDARASFSDSTPDSANYAENDLPFYQNSQYSSHRSSGSISSASGSYGAPLTPMRAGSGYSYNRGRGILDNDPSIYLGNDGESIEDSYWDTATKWAKAAGKRLSESEQSLWRIVSSVTYPEGEGPTQEVKHA